MSGPAADWLRSVGKRAQPRPQRPALHKGAPTFQPPSRATRHLGLGSAPCPPRVKIDPGPRRAHAGEGGWAGRGDAPRQVPALPPRRVAPAQLRAAKATSGRWKWQNPRRALRQAWQGGGIGGVTGPGGRAPWWPLPPQLPHPLRWLSAALAAPPPPRSLPPLPLQPVRMETQAQLKSDLQQSPRLRPVGRPCWQCPGLHPGGAVLAARALCVTKWCRLSMAEGAGTAPLGVQVCREGGAPGHPRPPSSWASASGPGKHRTL